MKKVLVVTRGFPLPATSGTKIRSWNFVRALADRCDVSLVYLTRKVEEPSPEDLALAKRRLTGLWRIQLSPRMEPRHDTLAGRFERKLRMIPWEIYQSYEPAVARALTQIVAERRFDTILARYIYQAQYLFDGDRGGSRILVDLDDIETRFMSRKRRITASGRLERWRGEVNNWVLSEYHRRRLSAVDSCIVCSDEDRRYVLDRRWATRVAVVPNAIDVADSGEYEPPGEREALLFCGTLSYEPNTDAVVWFARHVLPLVKRRHRHVKVLVVGSHPPQAVKALAADPSIEIHADVLDVRPFYRRATAIIVPLRIGSGTRFKILEAGAYRRPVVSTSIGAEGLELSPRRHGLIADDPADFATQCSRLLSDPNLARHLADQLHGFVESKYDTAEVFRKIQNIFGVADE